MDRPKIAHVNTHPAVAPEAEKLRKVQAEESATAAELREVSARVAASANPDGENRAALAAAYLATGTVDLDAAEGAVERQRRLSRLHPVLIHAVGEQTKRVEAARNKAAAELRQSLGATHRELVVIAARRAVEAAKANDAEAGLRDDITAAGYGQSVFPAGLFVGVGSARDPHGPLAAYVRELVRDGYLTGSEDFLKGVAR